MNLARRKNGQTPVRVKLLRAAVELFTTRGYATTSVREIVEGAGVTKPALYYHFASKEGIYLAILEDLQRRLDEVVAAHHASSGTVRSRVERLFLDIFDLFENDIATARFLNAAFWGPAQGAPSFDFEALHLKLLTVVTGIVKAGTRSGELRRSTDPEEVGFLLVGVLSFSMDVTLALPQLGPGKAGLRRALDLIFTGVAAPAASRRETAR